MDVPELRDEFDTSIANGLAFLRRRLTGDYEVDDFGFDADLTEHVFQPVLRQLYRHWFRTTVDGSKNIPAEGSALIVANHSGTVALDALMLCLAVHDETEPHRFLRLLAADLVFRLPMVSELARKSGATLACNPDVDRLLHDGHLVGVFPEGYKGVGKHYSQKYKLQRFGRAGFVSVALRNRKPIIPAAIVGAEEIYPLLGNIKPLARLIGAPYFPVTPTFPWLGPLGLVPLPSKWLIRFGDPIDTTPWADQADDPAVVFNLADQVRETIQGMLGEMLKERPDPFED